MRLQVTLHNVPRKTLLFLQAFRLASVPRCARRPVASTLIYPVKNIICSVASAICPRDTPSPLLQFVSDHLQRSHAQGPPPPCPPSARVYETFSNTRCCVRVHGSSMVMDWISLISVCAPACNHAFHAEAAALECVFTATCAAHLPH